MLKVKNQLYTTLVLFRSKKLLDIIRDKIRVKHYSIKTENVYIYWAKKYILFYNKRPVLSI